MLYLFAFFACSGARIDSGMKTDTAIDQFDGGEEGFNDAANADVQVHLNELLAKSSTTSDWIEIHNTGIEAVDLSGWGLVDDINEDEVWIFPSSSSIEPSGFVLVWADDGESGDGFHATFKLSKEGETIYFLDPLGNVVDEVEYPVLEEDQSYALQADDTWVITDQITPEAAN